MREALALRGEKDDGLAGEVAGGFGWDAEGVDALEDGLRLEDHALATAEGAVVDGAMTVVGPVAEVVSVNRGEVGAEGALEDAVAERALEEAGKEGDEVKAHEGLAGRDPRFESIAGWPGVGGRRYRRA